MASIALGKLSIFISVDPVRQLQSAVNTWIWISGANVDNLSREPDKMVYKKYCCYEMSGIIYPDREDLLPTI